MKFYFNVVLVLLSAILYLNTAYAGSVSARAGWVAKSGFFVGDAAGPNTTTALAQYADTAVKDKGDVGSFTGLGHASGGGYIKVRGILKSSNRFEIDDLVLSYTGTGVAAAAIRGDVHLSYIADVGGESGSANLKLGLDLGAGTGGFRFTHFLGFDGPIGGVVSESRNFTLGQIFTLQFIGELVIPSKLKVTPSGHRYNAGGSYSAFLGGSPVFNLPDGYVSILLMEVL